MELLFGKISIDILREVVFKNLGVKRKEVVLGPSVGIDGAVIDAGDKSLIVSMDPITGALERIGWLAVNINANDISTFGVEPAFFFSCILLSEKADKKTIETICVQMDKAAKQLGMTIAGGHCEVTPGLSYPIVVGCAMGVTEKGKYVTAGGAKPRDKLIMTKTAGIEGTAILASDKEQQLKKAVNASLLKKAKQFFYQISVVKEAITAYKTGGVNAMHDPTEGGIAGGIHEIADASNLGFKIFEEKIPVSKETLEICRFFKIDPFQLISSGALLISAKPEFATKITKRLEEQQIRASIIGEFSKNSQKRIIIRKDSKISALPRPLSDHLWAAIQR
ncbi:MAG: AIR synthase family protein [Candidatus Bathyarchaeota archaeon]|jgi:hydrogenase maturation factor|nr:hydrogenase [Candidatus Bathyarchaeota archaeon A05DMB-5]MDH7557665.1 AIR synthase family protein [Candidatus Bathyarchaeota archaeon]